MPWPLYPQERDLFSIVQEAQWSPGPMWVGVKDLTSPAGFNPWTVQPIASCYTDCSLPAQDEFWDPQGSEI
jgi:hypothetical protein